MSITSFTDHHTYDLLDSALEQLAERRGLSLASDDGLFSALGSLARQLDQIIEHAIAESDIGHGVTIHDIADLLDINPGEAQRRYQPEPQPF